MTVFGVRPTMSSPAALRIEEAGRLAQREMRRQAEEAARSANEALERARLRVEAARAAAHAAWLDREVEALRKQAADVAAEPAGPSVASIIAAVCSHFWITRKELLSARRTRTIVRPRQVAMFLAKEMTPRSLPEIGRRFGNRDHTTVLHACRKIASLIAADDPLAADVEAIRKVLLG